MDYAALGSKIGRIETQRIFTQIVSFDCPPSMVASLLYVGGDEERLDDTLAVRLGTWLMPFPLCYS